MLESQKAEAIRTQSDIRRTAEAHVAELEGRLDSLEQSLTRAKATIALVKEDKRNCIERLEMECRQLQEKLAEVSLTSCTCT